MVGSATSSQTCSRGASTITCSSTLISALADHRQRALGLQLREGYLHVTDDVVVDLGGVRTLAVTLAQVHRRQRLDRDLGGQRKVSEHVAHVEPPRQRQR